MRIKKINKLRLSWALPAPDKRELIHREEALKDSKLNDKAERSCQNRNREGMELTK